MLLFAALIACAPDETSDVVTLECAEGFGMSADGMCYPLAAEDTGPAWGVVEAACEGESYNSIAIDAPGPIVMLWGQFSPEALDLCAYYPSECPGLEAGATGTPVEPEAVTPTGVIYRCQWMETSGEVDGEARTWTGFTRTPIRAYYLLD